MFQKAQAMAEDGTQGAERERSREEVYKLGAVCRRLGTAAKDLESLHIKKSVKLTATHCVGPVSQKSYRGLRLWKFRLEHTVVSTGQKLPDVYIGFKVRAEMEPLLDGLNAVVNSRRGSGVPGWGF